MKSISSGILLYRIKAQVTEVFLVHPGGPFFRNKDQGWWTIPKGEPLTGEVLLATALREFQEETGYLPEGDFIALKPIVQKAGKMVHCWAVAGDLDPSNITCNTFALAWPPKSGRIMNFPEVDRGAWFSFDEAKLYINGRQVDFLDQLNAILTTG